MSTVNGNGYVEASKVVAPLAKIVGSIISPTP